MASLTSALQTSLPESVLLLALTEHAPSRADVRTAVAGAAVLGLTLAERVWVDDGHVKVTKTDPLDNPVLDSVLVDLARRNREVQLLRWIWMHDGATTKTTLAALQRAGFVRQEERRALGIFPRRRPQPDPGAVESLRAYVKSATAAHDRTRRDAIALLGVLRAAGLGMAAIAPDERAGAFVPNTFLMGDYDVDAVSRTIADILKRQSQNSQIAGLAPT